MWEQVVAFFCGYPSKDDLEKSISSRYDTPDQYQELLDYLPQPYWFDKVLREIKKSDSKGVDYRIAERP